MIDVLGCSFIRLRPISFTVLHCHLILDQLQDFLHPFHPQYVAAL